MENTNQHPAEIRKQNIELAIKMLEGVGAKVQNAIDEFQKACSGLNLGQGYKTNYHENHDSKHQKGITKEGVVIRSTTHNEGANGQRDIIN